MDYNSKFGSALCSIIVILTTIICCFFMIKYRPNAYEIKMNDKICFYVDDKEEFTDYIIELQNSLKEKYKDFKIEDKFTWQKVHVNQRNLTDKEYIKSAILQSNKKKIEELQKKYNEEKKKQTFAKANSKATIGNKMDFFPPCKGTVTSNFGMRWGKMHEGIDIANTLGSPIYAALDGVVTYSGWIEGYGNAIKISHGNGIETLYGHCQILNVKKGDAVKRGQLIAKMGSTGRSTGPHVHFEVIVNGVHQNPANYI